MGRVGLGVQIEHLVAVKAEKFLRVSLVEAVAEDGLRRVIVLLAVEPVRAAEIRDAALRADPRAAEKDNVIALGNPASQGFYGLFHGDSPLNFCKE